MPTEKIQKIAETFRFLGDPTRVKILSALFRADGIMCVNEIADAVGATQSATSHQLAKLEARDIVVCTRAGKTMCYRIKKSKNATQLENALAMFV